MDVLSIALSFVIGVFAGAGLTLFYIRWKMKKQLGMMQEQMGDIMDMTSDLEEEIPSEEAEEVDFDEVSEEEKQK